MTSNSDILERIAAKLATRAPLGRDDRQAIMALPFRHRTVEPADCLVREGEKPRRCAFMLSGYSFRQKLAANGSRQIVSLMIPGDFVDLQQLFLTISDHNVQVLTRAEIAEIEIDALREIVLNYPSIGHAMWIDALVDSAIYREWLINIGQRDARARISHLICEFSVRLKAAGIGDGSSYDLPMTQEQLGDALGLTSVHVNRVLKGLAEDGLITRDRRRISANDWQRLRETADFNERYLHLDQVSAVEFA